MYFIYAEIGVDICFLKWMIFFFLVPYSIKIVPYLYSTKICFPERSFYSEPCHIPYTKQVACGKLSLVDED